MRASARIATRSTLFTSGATGPRLWHVGERLLRRARFELKFAC
jgi:hypothetical protein